MPYIICNPEKCVGCGICELACSLVKDKSFNPLYSRIRAVRLESRREEILNTSIACLHCEEPACVRACPKNVLSVDEDGKITVNQDKCGGAYCCSSGPAWCTTACEFGAIAVHPEKREAIVCDLCPEEEEPPCVRFCPKEALSLKTLEEIQSDVQSDVTKRLLRDFSESRKKSKSLYERLGFSLVCTNQGKS